MGPASRAMPRGAGRGIGIGTVVIALVGGWVLGVNPNVLVVPPSLETAARRVLKATELEGSTNVWAGTAELIVSPYLED